MQLQFHKMNGAGNDFVVIDNRQLETSLSREQIALLCDRQRGVGAEKETLSKHNRRTR